MARSIFDFTYPSSVIPPSLLTTTRRGTFGTTQGHVIKRMFVLEGRVFLRGAQKTALLMLSQYPT